jgi:hypothetical protein
MPRKAPKEVIEHRITLGDYERKMIAKQLAEDDTIKKVQTGAEIGKTVLIGAGGIALGTLAVTAYREANDLIDTVTDVPAGLWKTAQYKLGLISLEQLVGSISDDVEENEKASNERKNKGVLEWGVEWLLKFLLGEDMIFTKATETTSQQDTTNPPDIVPYDGATEAGLYDPQDPYYSTQAGWYWDNQSESWRQGVAPAPPPKLKPQDGAEYWENLEKTFCDITSPDYDEEACRDVQFDKLRAGF